MPYKVKCNVCDFSVRAKNINEAKHIRLTHEHLDVDFERVA
jgi:hypothetical protein